MASPRPFWAASWCASPIQTFRDYLSLGRVFDIPDGASGSPAPPSLIAYVIQERTRLGRWLYAIGTDEMTARNAGIPVERTRIIIFGIAGAFLWPGRGAIRRRRSATAML